MKRRWGRKGRQRGRWGGMRSEAPRFPLACPSCSQHSGAPPPPSSTCGRGRQMTFHEAWHRKAPPTRRGTPIGSRQHYTVTCAPSSRPSCLPPTSEATRPALFLPPTSCFHPFILPLSSFPQPGEEEEEKEDEEEKEEGEEEGEDAVAVPPPPHGRTRLSHPRHHSRTHARTHGQRVKGKLPLQPDSVLT